MSPTTQPAPQAAGEPFPASQAAEQRRGAACDLSRALRDTRAWERQNRARRRRLGLE